MEYFRQAKAMIASKNAKGLKKILKNHSEIVCRVDEFGNSLLHEAAIANQPKCIEELLRCGAAIECTDLAGQSPLHCAAWFGNLEAVKTLVKNGSSFVSTLMRLTQIHEVSPPRHAGLLLNQARVIQYLTRKQHRVYKNKVSGMVSRHEILRSIYSIEEELQFDLQL